MALSSTPSRTSGNSRAFSAISPSPSSSTNPPLFSAPPMKPSPPPISKAHLAFTPAPVGERAALSPDFLAGGNSSFWECGSLLPLSCHPPLSHHRRLTSLLYSNTPPHPPFPLSV